ncbi:MAG TPA: methyl-accepting chemotaxis protein [Geobacteraceae bacterium]
MFLNRYLSSLRSTCLFMLCCGLAIGAVFPFYSAIFFGTKAFSPFYVLGCLMAGFLVGSLCYGIIRQVLKLQLERQWKALGPLAVETGMPAPAAREDALQRMSHCYDMALERVFAMTARAAALIDDIHPRHQNLTNESVAMIRMNEAQSVKVKETLQAVEEMNNFFNELLKDIEEIAVRTDERASISTQMSATTDAIADNVKEYSTSVLETSASIEEMLLSIKETTGNVEALALSTEQTSGSINQIGTAIANVRDNAKKTADCSEKVRLQAIEGIEAMAATTTAMGDIEKSSNDSFSAITRLALHTSRIGEFLNIIKDLVDQTNLLSLNASIIAAQAGERGKAFTVVAEEVRALAHRTSASTKEIEELVKNIQKETTAVERAVTAGKEKGAEGVRVAARAGEALHRIEESAAEASQMVQRIAAATMEQAVGSHLIADEAEKNLVRVQQVTRAIREQERGTNLIVITLERMRALSQKITTSTQEQARGNRLYLKSVLEDNDRVKSLRETSIQQIMMGDVVLNDVRNSSELIAANAAEARRVIDEIEIAIDLIETLRREMAPFSR